jgi:hypothetical protein
MNVAVALLSALVFLPPMLVWADQRNWVSRGLVSADILATATATYDTHAALDRVREPLRADPDPA